MLEKQNKSQPKGFTIIEVVLVLAIAGLIFLMVFIALPAMQRSQRDTQRRNDYSMLSTAVTSYSSSNQGKLYRLAGVESVSAEGKRDLDPATYINDAGEDPNGQTYKPTAYTWGGWSKADGMNAKAQEGDIGNIFPDKTEVYIVVGADCNGLSNKGFAIPKSNNSSRAFAIFGYVEGGSQTYCSSSQ